SEYRGGDSSPEGRNEGWSSFQDNFDKRSPRYEDNGYETQPSHHHDDNRRVVLRGVQEDPKGRHTPYPFRGNGRRVRWRREGNIHVTVWGNGKPAVREMKNTQDGAQGSWFKVTIPHGIKYDKIWLMNSIQSLCSVCFTPVDFHYVKNGARFFVQEASTASALMDVSYKIYDEENQKIPIFVNPSAVPYSVRNKLEPEEMEKLKLIFNKRFDVSQQSLDLQKLRFDPNLVVQDIEIILNRRNCMAAALQIIKKNFPKGLPRAWFRNQGSSPSRRPGVTRLDPNAGPLTEKGPPGSDLMLRPAFLLHAEKGLPSSIQRGSTLSWDLALYSFWGRSTPMATPFPMPSAIIECFPKLLRLDGQELPSPVAIDSDTSCAIKPSKENCEGSDTLKNLILQFLKQYYLIYDSGNRYNLLSAYHHKACFSLTIPFHSEDPALSSLCAYFKDSRNMKTVKDPNLRVQQLKHTNDDIVRALCVLPKTQHDLSSFMVDMWLQTSTMLCFSVSGVFKEVEGGSQDCVRAFTRTFITTPASSSSLCIVNDELFVMEASPKNTQSAFSIPVPTPSTSSVTTFSKEQQQMVQAFSTQSGMNCQWSQKKDKCLEQN
ncbi:hypothetical protein FD755_016202, partial [Muntiacus reevesi]